jgi:hypothetical protein
LEKDSFSLPGQAVRVTLRVHSPAWATAAKVSEARQARQSVLSFERMMESP